jgi:hypothetical protein
MKAFSGNLRQRILEAYDAGEGSRQDIADRFRSAVYRTHGLAVFCLFTSFGVGVGINLIGVN